MNRGVFIDRQRKGRGEGGWNIFLSLARQCFPKERKEKYNNVRVQATLKKSHRNHRSFVFTEAISGMVSVPAPKISGVV